MNGVVVIEVASPPGSRRFRLVGELTKPGVESLAAALRLTQLPGDVLLDLRELTDADGSAVTLLSRVAGRLGGRGRLYVLFPLPPLLRLIDESGLEQHLPNLTVVRHPSQALPAPVAPRAHRRTPLRLNRLSRG